jgi:hypothetical protein
VWGANDTKLAIALSPSTGRNCSPGTNSMASISLRVTNRPGPVGTPRASLLKWGSPLALVIESSNLRTAISTGTIERRLSG